MAVLVAGGSVAGPPDPGPADPGIVCSGRWSRTWLERELVLERRLEEGWLTAGGCLRHGHRVAHADAARAAIDGFNATASDQAARRAWLSGLQARFSTHPASSQP